MLSRRERQIIDILYRRGRATAADVMEDLPGDPSYSTVRTQLRVLEDKGPRPPRRGWPAVRLQSPAVPRGTVRRSALKHLVETFYEGSVGAGSRGASRRRRVAAVRTRSSIESRS